MPPSTLDAVAVTSTLELIAEAFEDDPTETWTGAQVAGIPRRASANLAVPSC